MIRHQALARQEWIKAERKTARPSAGRQNTKAKRTTLFSMICDSEGYAAGRDQALFMVQNFLIDFERKGLWLAGGRSDNVIKNSDASFVACRKNGPGLGL